MIERLRIMIFFPLLVFSALPGCEKNTDSASNKAYLSITQAAPNVQPLDVSLAGIKLTATGKLLFGSTTGIAGDPYVTSVSGTNNLRVTPKDSLYIDGNLFLQVNKFYSLFIYDTLHAGQLKALLLVDELNAPTDTISSMRFLDLVPDTAAMQVLMTNAKDTFALGQQTYVGENPSALLYSRFANFKSGRYNMTVAVDSIIVLHDSLSFSGGKIYSVFAQGFLNGSGETALKIGQVMHN
jgi:hypothetical protein